MAQRIKKEEESSEGGWMLTYGDLVTQLLVFFILLFTMSTIDMERLKVVVEFFRKSGGLESVMTGPPDLMSDIIYLKEARDRLEEVIQDMKMGDMVQTELEEDGLIIRLTDAALFPLGSAELRTEVYPLLDEIVSIVFPAKNPVRIEGHTCDLPISTKQFPSNWELSAARAIRVARYFTASDIAPERMLVVGYGEYRPLFPNNVALNRAKNRRVEITVKKRDI